jgi:hypothetical protein
MTSLEGCGAQPAELLRPRSGHVRQPSWFPLSYREWPRYRARNGHGRRLSNRESPWVTLLTGTQQARWHRRRAARDVFAGRQGAGPARAYWMLLRVRSRLRTARFRL